MSLTNIFSMSSLWRRRQGTTCDTTPEKSTGESWEASERKIYQGPNITSKTEEEDEKVFRGVVRECRSKKPALMDAEKLQFSGQDLAAISSTIQESPSLALEIGNLTNVAIFHPKYYFYYGLICSNSVPKIIENGEREVITFQQCSDWLQGMISYRICTVGLRLIINFQVGKSNGWVSVILALAPAEQAIDGKLFDHLIENNPDSTFVFRPDVKRANGRDEGTEIVVRSGKYWARVKFSKGPKVLMAAEIGCFEDGPETQSDENNNNIPWELLRRSMNSGPMQESISTAFSALHDTFACAVEIGNAMIVELKESSYYIQHGMKHRPTPVPEDISSFRKNFFVITGCAKIEGVASYRIESTDIRLVIAFKVCDDERSFAIGFVAAKSTMDSDILQKMLRSDDWRTRPDKQFREAKDGEIFIEIRNIMVCAKMSNSPRSTLKVAIRTF